MQWKKNCRISDGLIQTQDDFPAKLSTHVSQTFSDTLDGIGSRNVDSTSNKATLYIEENVPVFTGKLSTVGHGGGVNGLLKQNIIAIIFDH